MKIGERMRQLRKEKEMKCRDVAEMLSVNTSQIYAMESGRFWPSADRIKKLVEIFQMSMEEFMEPVEEKVRPKRGRKKSSVTDEMKKRIGEKIRKFRKEKKMTQGYIAENIGVTKQTICLWEKGKTNPSKNKISVLEEFLLIPKGELNAEIVTEESDTKDVS